MPWPILWALQAPATLPDLFWVVLTTSLGLLTAGIGLAWKLAWQVMTLRLESLRAELAARCAALEKDVAALSRWQDDHEP